MTGFIKRIFGNVFKYIGIFFICDTFTNRLKKRTSNLKHGKYLQVTNIYLESIPVIGTRTH